MTTTGKAAAMRAIRCSPQPAARAQLTTMPKRVAPDKCDCLLHCGDDPWLSDGRARPCAAKVKRDRKAAEVQRRFELQRVIADDAARRQVETGAPAIWVDGHRWLDIAEPAAEMARAAEYLVLRRLAEKHPHMPHLVRICPAATRPTLETTTP